MSTPDWRFIIHSKIYIFIDIYLSDNYIIIMDIIQFEWDENKNLIKEKT